MTVRFRLLHALLVSFDHLLDHLAADGAGFTAGQVAVVAVGQVDANFLGSLHLETVHCLACLRNIDLIVIVAGYTGPMEDFMNSNPGLESRFNKYFNFPDYNGEELYKIFLLRCKKNSYELSKSAQKEAKKIFNEMYENRSDNFGNGRDVRNFFEDTVIRQANRLAAMENPTKEDLVTITPKDLRVG